MLVAVLVARRPAGRPARHVAAGAGAALAEVRRSLVDTWREPGTRIGLYTHLVTQFSGTVFALLWGYPFLVVGQGLAPATAAGAAHPARRSSAWASARCSAGSCGRWPLRRSVLVLRASSAAPSPSGPSSCCGRAGRRCRCWSLLVVVLGTNGPGSMIGFDYART